MSRKVRGFLVVVLVFGALSSSFTLAGFRVAGSKSAPPVANGFRASGS